MILTTLLAMSSALGDGTVVTAHFDICAKYASAEYKAAMIHLLARADPMVIFTDSKSTARLAMMRIHAAEKTVIKVASFDSMWAADYGVAFWSEQLRKDPVRRRRCSVYQYWIHHQRSGFLNEVAVENPFRTTRFAWVDADYLEGTPVSNTPFLATWPVQLGPEQVLMLDASALHRNGKTVGGGFIGGTARAIELWTDAYYKTAKFEASLFKFIGDAQAMMFTACARNRYRCLLVPSHAGYGNPWNFMAPYMMGTYRPPKLNLSMFDSVHIISTDPWQARRLLGEMDLDTNRSIIEVHKGANYQTSPCQPARRREGCTMAHLGVLRSIAKRAVGWHLVLEDDAVASDYAKRNSRWAHDVVRDVDAHAVNIGPSHPFPAWGQLLRHPVTMIRQYLQYQLAGPRVYLQGWNAWTHAYMVTPAGATSLQNYVAPRMCENHWDVVLGHQARWDPAMQFIHRVYQKHAGWPRSAWRNYGLFGQLDNHASLTAD